ncbi:MAG TPA: glycosyltransferase [Myxococcota bacterium]|nr:glycosyltransferase [Myxococcota bacterium]HRY94541.1 glycosyltransferase [Myxococcota bacterium]HSA23555.1 glycosyltransferase [Myxococcota bacterium]
MIFEDPRQRRWRYTLMLLGAVALTGLVITGLVGAGLLMPPPIPDTFLRHKIISKAEVRAEMERTIKPRFTKEQLARLDRMRARNRWRRDRLVRDAREGAMPFAAGTLVAFVLEDDPLSVASLEKNLGQLDVVVPDWFELPGPGCELVEHSGERLRRLLARAEVLVLPRLANLYKGQWRGEETGEFLASDEARACLVRKLVQRLVELKAAGVNVDLEDLSPEDSEPFLEFLVELRKELHQSGLRLTVDVPFQDPAFDYEYIGKVSDAVLVMAYDEHFPSSVPGPIASRPWLELSLDDILPRIPADRLVMVLGAYGYGWNVDRPKELAEGISFLTAVGLARAAGSQPRFAEGAENAHFAYKDEDGDTHEVWFQDALTLWNQVQLARLASEGKLTRFGLWRLGTEDETLWSFLGQDHPPDQPYELVQLPAGRTVEFYGEGEILTVRNRPQPGHREIQTAEDGRIVSGVYAQVPTGFLVERRGGPPKQVVFTFDDGPSEEWTPRILEVLEQTKAPAAFFVIGEQVLRFPELVEDASEAGHFIGNHTFLHPHLEELTPQESLAELASTQRLIEGLTGRRTSLFRAPYTADVIIDDEKGLAPMRTALEAGYVVVGANVDSQDWKLPDGLAIAARVVAEIERGAGQVVLFHDGGGDRSATVEAVRLLVPALRTRGYEIVPLDKLLGLPRSEIEPPMPLGERVISWGNAALAWLRSWAWAIIAVLFFACTVLAALRILFLGAMVLFEHLMLRRAKQAEAAQAYQPLVTVIIPAFNEEKVIASTLASLQATGYPEAEFLVIDDGSKDRTAEVVTAIAARDPRVRLLSQPNSGKAAAANHALREARGEVIVAVDADTLVAPDAIPKLVRHFVDPNVTAVCGNVEVGNVNSWLTAFQAVEYVTSQNFDRRAFSALNCISVVPGALGAWRRAAVLAAGGYSQDTLTEDADLTLTILRSGGHVVYESQAIARTEAPESMGGFLRQRFRWTYGTYQCLWKHKRAFGRGTLGWVGLPNIVLFQILFPALSPIGDAVMVFSVIRGDWNAFLSGYLAFLAMDLCASLLAFWLDRKPKWWLLLLLIQRFCYRQIMYWVSLKAMVAALRGMRHGWRKLDRQGSVSPTPTRPPELTGTA